MIWMLILGYLVIGMVFGVGFTLIINKFEPRNWDFFSAVIAMLVMFFWPMAVPIYVTWGFFIWLGSRE